MAASARARRGLWVLLALASRAAGQEAEAGSPAPEQTRSCAWQPNVFLHEDGPLPCDPEELTLNILSFAHGRSSIALSSLFPADAVVEPAFDVSVPHPMGRDRRVWVNELAWQSLNAYSHQPAPMEGEGSVATVLVVPDPTARAIEEYVYFSTRNEDGSHPMAPAPDTSYKEFMRRNSDRVSRYVGPRALHCFESRGSRLAQHKCLHHLEPPELQANAEWIVEHLLTHFALLFLEERAAESMVLLWAKWQSLASGQLPSPFAENRPCRLEQFKNAPLYYTTYTFPPPGPGLREAPEPPAEGGAAAEGPEALVVDPRDDPDFKTLPREKQVAYYSLRKRNIDKVAARKNRVDIKLMEVLRDTFERQIREAEKDPETKLYLDKARAGTLDICAMHG